jgi:hypothetical protein
VPLVGRHKELLTDKTMIYGWNVVAGRSSIPLIRQRALPDFAGVGKNNRVGAKLTAI